LTGVEENGSCGKLAGNPLATVDAKAVIGKTSG
jgi:hypothetical protein